MENYLPLLQSTSLFAGISAGELRPLLSELGACIRSYGRGEALVQAGAPSRRVGVVLTGSIEAYRPAPGGARIPITHMGPGGVFGDVLGGSSLDSPVTVVASAPCEVLLFPYEKLLQPDGSAARQRLLLKTFETQVVGTPFEQRQFPGEFERFGDGRQIAAVKLILQRFRAGGDNHLFFRPQRRSQVSVGFTGSGPRFHHQRLAVINRLRDGVRHLTLRFTRFKAGYRLRKLAVCCKIVDHIAPWLFGQ